MKRRIKASDVTGRMLKEWDRLPFEQWPTRLKAVSANANGIVNSGILSDGRYFSRQWIWADGVLTSIGLIFEK